MATEPQRDIEKDLLAYKQRRHEQLGAPLELHPATRRMLQSEAARTASRPLLTSEEAAKNFVRSFVMSHQQPGFFARHKQRILWGGGMFACLAVVLAVLRNDPQRTARQSTFPDTLPTPAPAFAPPPAPPQSSVAANQLKVEVEPLARGKQPAPATDKFQEPAKHSAAPANPRPTAVASAPQPAVQRETLDRRSGGATPPVPSASAPAPLASLVAKKSEQSLSRALPMDAERKLVEKPAAGEGVQLAKSLKATEAAEVTLEFKAKPAGDELNRARVTTAAGVGGGAGAAPAMQQFLQLDHRAGYRQNFNSPPLPQVMQDFAFERSGDRVRIVDADGSTYEGTVLPAPAEEFRAKAVRDLDDAKVRKDTVGQQAQLAAAPAADTQASYRFYASGVNRKLNQSVEFRGEWRSTAPAQSAPAALALQAASFGAVRLEAQAAEKKEKALATNALSDQPAPAKTYLFQQQQKESSQGRISGRAVVGGKNEFDIHAVPK